MANPLAPGMGGAPSALPSDSKVVEPPGKFDPMAEALSNPLQPKKKAGPQGFGLHSQANAHEDQVAHVYDTMLEASKKVDAMAQMFAKLTAYKDTIDMEKVVDASADVVAAGVPAVAIAGLLADAPADPAALAAWAQQKNQEVAPQVEKMKQVMNKAGYALGLTAMKSIQAHSAEDFHQKAALAASMPSGSIQ